MDPARTDQFMNAVFRVTRYATNYAGLIGRDLTPARHDRTPRGPDAAHRDEPGDCHRAVQFGWSSLPDQNYAVLYKATLDCARLDQHRHQPQHRHADHFHGHQRRPAESTARLLSGDAVAVKKSTPLHQHAFRSNETFCWSAMSSEPHNAYPQGDGHTSMTSTEPGHSNPGPGAAGGNDSQCQTKLPHRADSGISETRRESGAILPESNIQNDDDLQFCVKAQS